jgi:uncharacterized protein (TIGR04255 family)
VTHPLYNRAPITEAVIEINFTNPLGEELLASASKKFKSNYQNHQSVQSLDVAVQIDANQLDTPKTEIDKKLGHRLCSADMTELIVLWPTSFVISQLAPYPGWDVFFERFVRDWTTWKRNVDFKQVSRLGVRYINRIDIPMPKDGKPLEFEAYLNVYPKLPDLLGPVNAYAVQAGFPIDDIRCQLTLNSAVVPAPILDHVSFLMDQDIAREIDPPQSDEAIYALLNKIRVKKNEVFESCISNLARKLFEK